MNTTREQVNGRLAFIAMYSGYEPQIAYIHEFLDAQQARIDLLEMALKPFAKAHVSHLPNTAGSWAFSHLDDFRMAHEALKGTTE